MAGPNDKKSSAISDFFGDDDDWFDEEEAEGGEAASSPAQAAPPAADPGAEQAAEAARQAEADRAAEVARQAEADRAAEAARQAEADRAAEAARQAEADRAAEAARQAESERQQQAALQAEAAAVEAGRRASAPPAAPPPPPPVGVGGAGAWWAQTPAAPDRPPEPQSEAAPLPPAPAEDATEAANEPSWGRAVDALLAEAEADGSASALLRADAAWVSARFLGRDLDGAGDASVGPLAVALIDRVPADRRAAAHEAAFTGDNYSVAHLRLAARAAEADAAVGLLRRAIEQAPDDLAAAWLLFERAGEAGRAADQAFAAERIASLTSGAEAGAAWRSVAGLRHVAGDEAGAIAALQAGAAADPSSPEIAVALNAALAGSADASALATWLGERAATGAPADAAWWALTAARAWRRADGDEAVAEAGAAYARSLAFGGQVASVEGVAWALSTGQTDDAIGLLSAITDRNGEEAPAAAFLLGACLEVLRGDAVAARDAYERALSGGIGPAAEAVGRVLVTSGDADVARSWWAAQVEARPDDAAARLVLAGIEESADPKSDAAFSAYRGLAESPAADRRALEGLARLARRRDDPAALVEALVQLGERARTVERKAELRQEAAMILRYRLGDFTRAGALLEGIPLAGNTAREMQVTMLVEQGRALEAATMLARGSEELPGVAGADLSYRAALLAWTAGGADVAQVADWLSVVLAQDPDHDDARRLLAQVAGARQPELLLTPVDASNDPAERLVAGAWAMVCGQRVPALTADVGSDHAGLAWMAAVEACRSGDLAAFGTWLARSDTAERRLARAALAADPAEALAGSECAGSVALALAASGLGLYAEAAAAADGASLDARRAAAYVAGLRGESTEIDLGDDPSATARQARAAARGAAEIAAAEEGLAATSAQAAAYAAHARLAALAWLEAGEPARAVAALQTSAGKHPMDAEDVAIALRASIAAADAGAIEAAVGSQPSPGGPLRLAEALSAAGLPDAIDAWALAADDGPLVALLGHEVALGAAERWSEVVRALGTRKERTQSPVERARIETMRRSLLADRLAESDEAWELYQGLHREDPADRDVLENLARIAGARGDRETAIGYLEQLAESAPVPSDAARCYRRIAEIWLRAPDEAYATQAYYNALDYQPDDTEALAGLQRLARQQGDWEALLSVLRREASIREGAARLAVLREIAEVVDQHVGGAAAIDAWRAVVEVDPGERTANGRLLDLAESAGDHESFLEVAAAYLPFVMGDEAGPLLRRMGLASEAVGRRDEAVGQYEQAVAAPSPDAAAARRLEALFRLANDWPGVVRALQIVARLSDDGEERIRALEEAARVEREVRHDRDGAGRIFEALLAQSESHDGALRFLVRWFADTGRPDEALALAERLSPTLPETPSEAPHERIGVASLHFQHAELLRAVGRSEEARAHYLSAIEHNPVHLPALEAVGPLLAASGDWTRTGDIYLRILQVTGGEGEAQRVAAVYAALGRVALELNDLPEASLRYNQSLEAFANHVPALRGKARILEAEGDWNNLLTIYNSVIYYATTPQDVIEAYMTKGRVLDEELGRQDKAAQHYERSLAFEARQPAAYLRLAEIALRREAWDEALSLAARGLEVGQDRPDLAAELHIVQAIALAASEDATAAEGAIQAAWAVDPASKAATGERPLADIAGAARALRVRLPR